MGNPFPVSLPAESRKAAASVRSFTSPQRVDRAVPRSVLARAQGFAIFSVFRIGFLMSARGGAGVVVARLPDGGGWSPPAAIGLGGLGGGFNCGAEVTDFLIVLTSRRAVSTFMANGSLQLGGNMALAIGPLGRAAEAGGSVASNGKLAALLSYSKSKGLYGGISLEGTVLLDRSDANAKAYGPGVTSRDILSGRIEPPDFAVGLVETLNRATGRGSASTQFNSPYHYYDADHSAAARNGYSYDHSLYDDDDSSSDDARDSFSNDWPVRRSRGATNGRGHKRSMSMWDPPSNSSSYEPRGAYAPGYGYGSRFGSVHRDNDSAFASTADRARLDEMDPLDRELQQAPSAGSGNASMTSMTSGWPAERHARSRTVDHGAWSRSARADSFGSSAFGPARSSSFNMNPYAASMRGGNENADFDEAFDLGPRRAHRTGSGVTSVVDYESQLAPARTGMNSWSQPQSVSSWSARPTSPIGMENGSSSAVTSASASGRQGNGSGVVELPLSETRLVMAKFAFTPTSPTDLALTRGDVIRVTKCSSTRDDWWSGECHGSVGWFPANRTVDL